MNKKIQKYLLSIMEYVPILLTVFFGGYVVLKTQSETVSSDKILVWILTILCLLATSILVDRFSNLRRIEQQTKEVNDIIKGKNGQVSISRALNTRKSLPPLEERLQSAQSVFITGGALFRLSSEYTGLFENLAKDDCKIQLLLLNPDANSAKLTAENIVYEVEDYSTYRNYITSSLNNFDKLRTKYPKKIEIMISDYLPSFGLLGVDVEYDRGNIMVEIYTNNVPTRERPHFKLLKKRDPLWFEFFLNQFNVIWEKSKNYEKKSTIFNKA